MVVNKKRQNFHKKWKEKKKKKKDEKLELFGLKKKENKIFCFENKLWGNFWRKKKLFFFYIFYFTKIEKVFRFQAELF